MTLPDEHHIRCGKFNTTHTSESQFDKGLYPLFSYSLKYDASLQHFAFPESHEKNKFYWTVYNNWIKNKKINQKRTIHFLYFFIKLEENVT